MAKARLLVFAVVLASCSSTTPAPIGNPAGVPPAPPEVPALAEVATTRPRAIDPSVIVESPASRDPFRTFDATPPAPPPDARPRKARRVPVADLRLVGLVTNIAVPRAMLVDGAGKGYVVQPGDLVGRPEPDGQRTASYRVDRIREGNLVLVREDGAGLPGDTRVLALPVRPLLQADD